MAKDYPYNQNAEPSPLWSFIKEYFFCDADENLHWSDIAWMVGVAGIIAVGLLVITL